MARDKDTSAELPEEPGGTLADAISAHLALKRDHGSDPEAIEQEQADALAPPRREVEPPAAVPAPEPGSELAPEPAEQPIAEAPAPEPAPEPEPEPAPDSEPEPTPEPEPDPEPVAAAPPTPTPQPDPPIDPGLREDTGTIEFEWGDESSPPEPEEAAEPLAKSSADVLEQTPEFFEETPEYDKLWFEERPPREFDF